MNPMGNPPGATFTPSASSVSPLTPSVASSIGPSASGQDQALLNEIRAQQARGQQIASFMQKIDPLREVQRTLAVFVDPLRQLCQLQTRRLDALHYTMYCQPSVAFSTGMSPLEQVYAERQAQRQILNNEFAIRDQMRELLQDQQTFDRLIQRAIAEAVTVGQRFCELYDSYLSVFPAPQNPANLTTQSVALPPPAAMPVIALPPPACAAAEVAIPASILGSRTASEAGFPPQQPNPPRILRSMSGNHFFVDPSDLTIQSVAWPLPAAIPAIELPPSAHAAVAAAASPSVLGPRTASAAGFLDERPNPSQMLRSEFANPLFLDSFGFGNNVVDPSDSKNNGNL